MSPVGSPMQLVRNRHLLHPDNLDTEKRPISFKLLYHIFNYPWHLDYNRTFRTLGETEAQSGPPTDSYCIVELCINVFTG